MSVTLTISTKLYNTLVSLAESYEPIADEEFDAYSNSGGNFDDAYSMGESSGREELAFEIVASHNAKTVSG